MGWGVKNVHLNINIFVPFYIFVEKDKMEISDWKVKALQRSKETKQLKKKIKELAFSRDEWKNKSMSHKSKADKLAADLKKIKDKLNEITNQL